MEFIVTVIWAVIIIYGIISFLSDPKKFAGDTLVGLLGLVVIGIIACFL